MGVCVMNMFMCGMYMRFVVCVVRVVYACGCVNVFVFGVCVRRRGVVCICGFVNVFGVSVSVSVGGVYCV